MISLFKLPYSRENIEKQFSDTIQKYSDKFEEGKENLELETEFSYEIEHDIIREYTHDPEDILKRCRIIKEMMDNYLFNWDEIPGKDDKRLIRFLEQNFGIDWVKKAKIEKIDDGITIRVFTKKNSLSLRLNDEKTKVNLEIDDGRIAELIAKAEEDFDKPKSKKLNIYIDKEIFAPQIKEMREMISLSLTRGFFTACKYFLIKNDERYVTCFKAGSRLYEKYPKKASFVILLEHINFKTGPLSDEDIKQEHLYFKELYGEENVKNFERILASTGCFGISGGRGMGKSTLLNAIIYGKEKKEKISNALIVKLVVESKYEAEPFLTALLSKICEQTIRKIKKGWLIGHLINISYRLIDLYLILLAISLVILFLLYEVLPSIFLDIDYARLRSVTMNVTWLLGLLSALLTVVLMGSICYQLNTISPKYIIDYLHVYLHVNRIYNDIGFIKTSEITQGVKSQFFSVSRRTTLQENPINYSTPLLSLKIKDVIEEYLTKKAFSKVIIFIDDLDKLNKDDIFRILENIRFLSSTKNCLTFISVPPDFKKYFEDPNSEVRTLFDQMIDLEIRSKKDVQELIEHRIMNYEIGQEFSNNKELIRDKDKFYDYLSSKSGGVPREAIRLFNYCFLKWYGAKRNTTIDEECIET